MHARSARGLTLHVMQDAAEVKRLHLTVTQSKKGQGKTSLNACVQCGVQRKRRACPGS